MNIGIILYSFSGNTLSVAERLKETLSAAGHAVNLHGRRFDHTRGIK